MQPGGSEFNIQSASITLGYNRLEYASILPNTLGIMNPAGFLIRWIYQGNRRH